MKIRRWMNLLRNEFILSAINKTLCVGYLNRLRGRFLSRCLYLFVVQQRVIKWRCSGETFLFFPLCFYSQFHKNCKQDHSWSRNKTHGTRSRDFMALLFSLLWVELTQSVCVWLVVNKFKAFYSLNACFVDWHDADLELLPRVAFESVGVVPLVWVGLLKISQKRYRVEDTQREFIVVISLPFNHLSAVETSVNIDCYRLPDTTPLWSVEVWYRCSPVDSNKTYFYKSLCRVSDTNCT